MDYKLEYFEKHNDERGQLVVFLKNRDLGQDFKQFGQIYFVTFDNKDIVRGNHYHKRWREWFGVVQGKMLVALKDLASGKVEYLILDGDSDQYVRLEIGPNIVHSFKSLTPTASLLNYTDVEWSPDDTFAYALLSEAPLTVEALPSSEPVIEGPESTNPHQILRDVELGQNAKVWNFTNLYGCKVGDDSMIGTYVEIQAGAEIGKRCRIQSHTFICEGVTIEDDVFVGHGVMFINDNHPKATAEHKESWRPEPVRVGAGSSIGSGAVILGGITIGKGATIGAGAVVTKDIPDGAVVAGVPARKFSVVRW